MNMHVCVSPVLPRRLLLAAAVAGWLPALHACSAPVAAMRVGSIVYPGYESMFLARELGLLDERRVRLVELLHNSDTLRALAAGQLEAAALSLDGLLTARADGVDLRAVLVFDVAAGAGHRLDVLAVRADALELQAAALRHLLQCHFAAHTLLRESPQRCTALMALRLQTPAAEVMALLQGLQLPDLAQNRRMLAAGGSVEQAAQALQLQRAQAGGLAQALADPQYLPL
jgi:hypothetical protein